MWMEFTLRLVLGISCVSAGSPVVAQSSRVTEGEVLEFAQAIALTLQRNPVLVATGYRVESERARLTQAELPPNPELSVALENVAGSGPYSGYDGAETTISLGWLIERGKRTGRIETAQAGVSLAETDSSIRRLDVAAETARMFLDCLAYQTRQKQMTEAIELTRATVAAVSVRVGAGRSPAADLARIEAELARLFLAREELEHGLLVAHHRLAAQWGDRTPRFSTVLGNLDNLPALPSFDALLRQVVASPDQQRYLSEQRLREAELRQAERNAKPSWRLSTGIRRLELTDDHAFVAELNIPLAWRNRNEGRIAQARSALAQTSAHQEAAALRTEVRLFALYQELQHSLHQARAFRDDIMPKVETALEETERAYERGRYGFFELSAARSELLESQNAAVQAAIDTLRNIVEIERLTGVSLRSSLAGSVGGAS